MDRSWEDGFEETPKFWNPKRRGPICFNHAAAKKLVPLIVIRTRLALAGKSKAEIKEGLKAAIGKGELPPIELGAMCFLLSKQGQLSDRDGHWYPHRMFFAPAKDAQSWGPVIGGADPEQIAVFAVKVDEWSDSTEAPNQ